MEQRFEPLPSKKNTQKEKKATSKKQSERKMTEKKQDRFAEKASSSDLILDLPLRNDDFRSFGYRAESLPKDEPDVR